MKQIINRMELRFPSGSVNESFARGAVSAFVLCLDPLVTDLKTAVSEAVTNAIVHGYRDTIGTVYITAVIYADGTVQVKVRDRGCGIPDIEKAMEPLFTTGGEERAGLGFATVECGTDILSALGRMDPGGAVLLDSVTALLSNEMFRADGTLDADAPERLERELLAFSRQMRCCVFVSDYIYADGGQYDAWTEAYRRGLARLDRALAAACENAAELCCAQTYWYKGGFDR